MVDITTFYWSDSKTVLSWINSQSSDFHTFVANRISAIHELSQSEQWRYVPGRINPADLLTRPMSPRKLSTCNTWFFGPLFLHGAEQGWPTVDEPLEPENDVERKVSSLATTAAAHFVFDVQHGNSFGKLQRITGYVLRFIRRCQNQPNERQMSDYTTLSQKERRHALYCIVKAIQAEDFNEDISYLKRHNEVHPSSLLNNLTPFLDDIGIIRVGGRLEASNLSRDAKHPMLLPYSNTVTRLIMEQIHKEHSHVNIEGLITITRQQFWPINARTIARSIVHKCVKCTRANPKLSKQIMGNLPEHRVQPARPFINSGVDFCGPVYYHFNVRGKHPQKTYIAVFCCFASKAVHLELVSNLTTEAFLGALRRFIGRRGHCKNLYCDNATNFVGARNQLQELHNSIYSNPARDAITTGCSEKGIDFHFIPPRAPHFGGLWEAAVKSAKTLLKKTLEPATFTYEKLATALVEIEAILNSRPLSRHPSNPNDPAALTPGHFLIGEPLTAQVDPEAQARNTSLSTDWRQISRIKKEFWQRWSNEYLHLLQQRHGWKRPVSNIALDTIVIIKDDSLPVMKWPLGRVIKTYEGNDEFVRVVDVKTADSVLTRPIHRLAPLPVDQPESSEPDSQASNPEIPSLERRHTQRNEGSPKKRIKLNKGSLLTTLFTCIIFPICHGQAVTNIKTEKLNNSFGIYFESMGSVSRVINEWNIVVYYDLNPYWREMALLKNGTTALRHLCGSTHLKETCENLAIHFEHDLLELTLDNSLFTANRIKRGAIDIFGNIANSLFGILDSSYAKEMSTTIQSIKMNEGHLVRLLKNQTSVIDSTINIMKTSQLQSQYKFRRIDQTINLILDRINKNGTQEYNIMNTLSLQLIATSVNLHRIQTSIINTLTATHHGSISPLLLSPEQLREEIQNIRSSLPQDAEFPTDNIMQLYYLMKVAGRFVDNYVIFTVKLPLISRETFELFNLLSIPVRINDTLTAIKLSTKMLATSPHRDVYFPINEADLNSCDSTESQHFFCAMTGPLYHLGAQLASCEMNVLTKESITSCQTEIIPLEEIWMQLKTKTKWLYGLRTSKRLQAVCDSRNSQIGLQGSGILTLPPRCVLKHDTITLTAHNILPNQIKTSFVSTDILVELPSSSYPLIVPQDNITYQPQDELLTKLQQTLRNETLGLTLTDHSHAIYHVVPGYMSIALISIAICSLICINRHRICKPKPVPAPRSSLRPDFSINV